MRLPSDVPRQINRWTKWLLPNAQTAREPRLTRGLDGKSGVRNTARGKRERNAAPLRCTVTDQQMDEMVIAQRDRESFFDLVGAGVGAVFS